LGDAGIERNLVGAENARPELLQHEGPAAGTGTEIEADLARLRPRPDARE
jgi:hypothetical protein